MAKRKHSETSEAAHISMIPVIPTHHEIILLVMELSGEGIYEEIAGWCRFKDKNMVSRRLAELERLGKVEKTGEKRLTSSKRQAFVYRKVAPKPTKSATQESFQQQSLFKN